MIKAILFDLNGVIIDDELIHELAFQKTVQPYGISLSHQDYLECCAGKTDQLGYELIATKFSQNLPIYLLLKQKNKLYQQLFPIHQKSYPGIIDLIYQLSKKYRLALTSGSTREQINLITTEFKINHLFAVTISADDVTHSKPDPEPYLITIQKLKVSPQECIVIEDSPSGVLAAKTAGCVCIAVTTTHSAADLKKADLIVNNFFQINEETIFSLV